MSISRLTIQEFLNDTQNSIVLDVRSPGEFQYAHIPGACSLALFTDAERKIVGTAYKQESRENAIKLGLAFFGPKMVSLIEEVQTLISNQAKTTGARKNPRLLVHCWRGGMRSAGVAWLLDLYGFEVCTLTGGYKAYRNWVLQQFAKEYPLALIGGYTGSGKTNMLHQLQKQGHTIIDLEALAKHKGSAFGELNGIPQPSQEMFENLLATALSNMAGKTPIWLEDESQRIGVINIPTDFFRHMRNQPLYFMDVPFEARLELIVKDYGGIAKEALVNAIIRIKKRLGGLETKTAINHLVEDNPKECFRILLLYYDKLYLKGLQKHEPSKNSTVILPTESTDMVKNTAALLNIINKKNDR